MSAAEITQWKYHFQKAVRIKVLSRNPQSLLQSGNLQEHQILELTPVKHYSSITARHHSLVYGCINQILGKYEPSNIIGVYRKCFCRLKEFFKDNLGTSLVVQWLRLRAPNAGGPGLIPGQGTSSHVPQLRVRMRQLKIPHAATEDPARGSEDPVCCN